MKKKKEEIPRWMLNIKNFTQSNLSQQCCQGCLVAELTPESKRWEILQEIAGFVFNGKRRNTFAGFFVEDCKQKKGFKI